MGRALIQGLLAANRPANTLWAVGTNPTQLADLQQALGINVTQDAKTAVRLADIVILAVKPKVIPTVCATIQASVALKQPLIISVASGVTDAALRSYLSESAHLVRAMPNTPVAVGVGATVLYTHPETPFAQRQQAEALFAALGSVWWLTEESQLSAVTALSGSGPAYFYVLMEGLEKAAHSLGLPHDLARGLIQQTALGAAKMAMATTADFAALRQAVTSPQGGTERAIHVLTEHDFLTCVATAVAAAHERYLELMSDPLC